MTGAGPFPGPGQAPGGPFPTVERDPASAAFFDAAARGELLVRRCRRSGDVVAPEVRTCPACGSAAFDDVVVSGRGTLVSWAVVHQPPRRSLAAAVPYVSAIVELAEGPWLLVRLVEPARLVEPESAPDGAVGSGAVGSGVVGSGAAGLRTGAAVEVRFVRSGDAAAEPAGEILPVFVVVAVAVDR